MDKNSLVTLLKFKRWIDAETLKAIKCISKSAYADKHHQMLRLMNHIHVVDMIFSANISGQQQHGYTAVNTPETPSVDELAVKMEDCTNGYIQRVSSMEPAEFVETIKFRFVDGGEGEMTAKDMLNHMLLHGTYHRGAVGWLISECGGVPPKDVLTVFLRDHNY